MPDDAVIDTEVLSVSCGVLKPTAEAIDTNLYYFETEEYCNIIVPKGKVFCNRE
jgi:hypothetical protein